MRHLGCPWLRMPWLTQLRFNTKLNNHLTKTRQYSTTHHKNQSLMTANHRVLKRQQALQHLKPLQSTQKVMLSVPLLDRTPHCHHFCSAIPEPPLLSQRSSHCGASCLVQAPHCALVHSSPMLRLHVVGVLFCVYCSTTLDARTHTQGKLSQPTRHAQSEIYRGPAVGKHSAIMCTQHPDNARQTKRTKNQNATSITL